MKNKICISKKIVQFFCIFLLIIGFFILASFINKAVLLSQNATASWLSTTSTPTRNIRPPECVNNPHKDCSQGQVMVYKSGFCSCVSNQPTPISLLTSQDKRCVYVNNTSPTIIYPSRVEKNINGSWQTVENCSSSKICNPITFKCEVFTPKPLTKKKIAGESCKLGLDCQSGICDSRYLSPQGIYIFLPEKKCTYSLADQKKFMEQKLQNDRSVLQVGTTTVAILYAPAVGDAVLLKAVSATPAVYSFLQQPIVKKILDIMNVGGTAFSIADCIKNGTGGDLCQLYVAGASINPGETSLALENSLKNLLPNSTNKSFVIGRKPTLSELKWIKKNYGVEVEISETPMKIGPYNYSSGSTKLGSKKMILYPYPDSKGIMQYDLLAALNVVGEARGGGGQVVATSMSQEFANTCVNCRWTADRLMKDYGLLKDDPRVLSELDKMNIAALKFQQNAEQIFGLRREGGRLITGAEFSNVYRDHYINNVEKFEYIDPGSFTPNFTAILFALGYR